MIMELLKTTVMPPHMPRRGLTKNKFYTDLVIEYIQKSYYELPGKIVSVELSRIKPNPGVIGVLLLSRKIFGGV